MTWLCNADICWKEWIADKLSVSKWARLVFPLIIHVQLIYWLSWQQHFNQQQILEPVEGHMVNADEMHAATIAMERQKI